MRHGFARRGQPPRDPPVDGKSLGAGMSMGEWLEKPDKQVTRRELWDFLRYVETVRQNNERRNRWWRRLWHYLTEPIVERRDLEGPSTPSPS